MVGLAQEPLAILQEHGWEALLELRRRTKQGRQLLPGWARHKALASDQSLQEVVLVGADSGLPAAAQGAAGEQEVKLEESVTAGELPPQLQVGHACHPSAGRAAPAWQGRGVSLHALTPAALLSLPSCSAGPLWSASC